MTGKIMFRIESILSRSSFDFISEKKIKKKNYSAE